MGNTIVYDKAEPHIKADILDKFKQEYSSSDVITFPVRKVRKDEYCISVDKYLISFDYLPYLVDFVCELNRPFILSGPDDRGSYNVCFIYSRSSFQSRY